MAMQTLDEILTSIVVVPPKPMSMVSSSGLKLGNFLAIFEDGTVMEMMLDPTERPAAFHQRMTAQGYNVRPRSTADHRRITTRKLARDVAWHSPDALRVSSRYIIKRTNNVSTLAYGRLRIVPSVLS